MYEGDQWPDDAVLYQPFETNQSLIYEYANCLSARAFLHICQLKFHTESKPNAEFMSPSGVVPFIRARTNIVAEFEPIVEHVAKTGHKPSSVLDEPELADMTAHICLVKDVLENVEMYVCWVHASTLREVTKPRYGSVYPWPLNSILPWLKEREMKRKLKLIGWLEKSLNKVLEEMNEACKALSLKLSDNDFFCGDQANELDAFVFGHLYTLLTTELPEVDLAAIVKRYSNLISFCQRIEKAYFMSGPGDRPT